jgi:hypothetical protein
MQRKLSAKAMRLCPARSGRLLATVVLAAAAVLVLSVVAAVVGGCMMRWCLYAACMICVSQCDLRNIQCIQCNIREPCLRVLTQVAASVQGITTGHN